jgi:hypothetical protein
MTINRKFTERFYPFAFVPIKETEKAYKVYHEGESSGFPSPSYAMNDSKERSLQESYQNGLLKRRASSSARVYTLTTRAYTYRW